MAGFDKNRFTFRELTMNQDGKQSGSGFIGVYLGLISGIMALGSMVGYFIKIPNTIEFMGQILQLIAAATILLTARKLSGDYLARKNGNGNGTANGAPPANNADVNKG